MHTREYAIFFFIPYTPEYIYFFFLTRLLSTSFWTSRGHRCRPFPPPPVLAFNFITQRVQLSHCSSIFHRVLLTHAVALSASQCVHKKKSQRIYTSMHSAGLELTKLTYTRLEDNLIRHRGDRLLCSNYSHPPSQQSSSRSSSDPGSHRGPSSPFPTMHGTCLSFYREKNSAFSFLVDSRRSVCFFLT